MSKLWTLHVILYWVTTIYLQLWVVPQFSLWGLFQSVIAGLKTVLTQSHAMNHIPSDYKWGIQDNSTEKDRQAPKRKYLHQTQVLQSWGVGARGKGIPYYSFPLSFGYSARQKCIFSFGGDCNAHLLISLFLCFPMQVPQWQILLLHRSLSSWAPTTRHRCPLPIPLTHSPSVQKRPPLQNQ